MRKILSRCLFIFLAALILVVLAAFFPWPGTYSFEGAWRYDASENRYCSGDRIYLSFRDETFFYRVSDGGTSPCSFLSTNPLAIPYVLNSQSEEKEGPSTYVLTLDAMDVPSPLELTFWPGSDSLNVFGCSFKRLTLLEEILIKILPTTLGGAMIFTP
ncbi:TPA: hypothetical protein DEP34_03025 [Candidatus Uhrbacteria bacterium]|uniref:Uncharacterized protein n=2 Tax=Candidatus Uhriibacteriota TaxID=1752732 RepID=A0A0G1Q8K5_9BACT|nr:MAG: hypothetical protein UX45_C0001G0050 [Candidatus Uhrbacteria bacterium GW2011_GWF2_46_218]KKU41386.1 MAG: hypothetical protein UX57_C0004G0090 [Candidatus Uhrbacteria bacterium GW2011_GWE2_46_68]HBK33823.1 hypothetical protein [Candidatus Uhrbacteria bacterium]HCB19336.1 hypothetical protein [Candidatus Uhrbacteria bacterium]